MPKDVTQLLSAIESGNSQAAEDLLPLAYNELRRIAQNMMRHERQGHTLQPTALVHEAYLKLVGPDGEERHWKSRGYFFAAAAEAMRRILIENARKKLRHKRGEKAQHITFDENAFVLDEPSEQLLALNDALNRLEQVDPLLEKIVKLRYFAGLKTQEVATVLGKSESTVNRSWKAARAWLFREMTDPS